MKYLGLYEINHVVGTRLNDWFVWEQRLDSDGVTAKDSGTRMHRNAYKNGERQGERYITPKEIPTYSLSCLQLSQWLYGGIYRSTSCVKKQI